MNIYIMLFDLEASVTVRATLPFIQGHTVYCSICLVVVSLVC